MTLLRIERVGANHKDDVVGVDDRVLELFSPDGGRLDVRGVDPMGHSDFVKETDHSGDEVAVLPGVRNEHVVHRDLA